VRKFLSAVIVISVILLAGCSGAGKDAKTLPAAKPTSAHRSVFIDKTRLEMATIKEVFPRDEIVPLRISVTNTDSKDIKLTFPTAQRQEFIAVDQDDKEVWRWSSGRMFAQQVTEMKIEAGATYNFFGKIEAGVLPAGKYEISGWTTADELFGEKITLSLRVK